MSEETQKAIDDARARLFAAEGRRDELFGSHPHDLEALEAEGAELREIEAELRRELDANERAQNEIRIKHQSIRSSRSPMLLASVDAEIANARAILAQAQADHERPLISAEPIASMPAKQQPGQKRIPERLPERTTTTGGSFATTVSVEQAPPDPSTLPTPALEPPTV